MERNAEMIKKSLDWLDSLVGNSNDSDMALLTYQLLGILYDTCEELTEENERLQKLCDLRDQDNKDTCELLFKAEDENKRLAEENERLRAELEQRPPKLIITKLLKKENENV